MPNMKDEALAYAARGWPIFPARANKKPYTDSGVLDATTNKKQIADWWTLWPQANIALDVGAAGMVVLDFDPGSEWGEVIKNVGNLPDTHLIQNTPRGGEHHFYRKDRDEIIPLSAGKIADHVDIRSHNSYVLLAPSKTKDGVYTWEEEGKPAYRTDRLVEVAGKKRDVSEDRDEWIIEPDLPESIADLTKWLKKKAQIAVDGRNGDEMAYRTAAMCKSYGVSPETAFDLMWEHWNPRCDPPWSDEQIEHLEQKIVNGYTYNTSPPGNLTKGYKAAKRKKLFKRVKQEAESAKGDTAQITVGRFRIIDREGIKNIKPPEWLIEDVLPEGSYSMLIGPRSTYKTFVALDMAMSIACGGDRYYSDVKDWRGLWGSVKDKGAVLYAAGEGRGGFKHRIEAWESYHLEGDEVSNFFLADPVPHPTEEDIEDFINYALLKADKYKLVVLDTVARSMQGLNENSQQDASAFTLLIQTIQQELGCAVLTVHHTGHGSDDRARGSSVFGADVDTEFVMEKRDPHYVQISNTKQKDASEWDKPKLVHVFEHKQSLVASTPPRNTKATVQSIEDKQQSKGKKKRRNKVDSEGIDEMIRDVAYRAIKKVPVKDWSRSLLSAAIAKNKIINLAASTIRTKHMDCLLMDKDHLIWDCYDENKGVWRYNS